MRSPAERLRFISIFMVVFIAIIIVALFNAMVIGHADAMPVVEKAVRGEYAIQDEPWGLILDRKGELLSGILPAYYLDAEIAFVTDTVKVAQQMAPLLNLPEEDVLKLLELPDVTYPRYWTRMGYGLTEEQMQALTDARMVDRDGVGQPGDEDYKPGTDIWPILNFTPSWMRVYPEGNLCSQVLGYTDFEGQGVNGIEQSQQHHLRPEQVASTGDLTKWRYPLPETILNAREVSAPGTDIYLTIDRTIQAYVEDELERILLDYAAESGTIIVMQVKTGDILAMVNRPDYYPENVRDYVARDEADLFENPAVSFVYEPGSVFKAFTVAAALDSNSIPEGWTYYDTGLLEYRGLVVPNAMGLSYGTQDVQGILDNSLNVGVATITTQLMDKETFYSYIRKFGFGDVTQIELANEIGGIIHQPEDLDWEEYYRAGNAYGQSISVTPLQMVNAMNAIANNGTLLVPHIISKRVLPDGQVQTIEPKVIRQVITEATAAEMQLMLEHVLTAKVKAAQVPGYRVAGKTGTAEIPIVGGYDPVNTITSFVGFGPLPDPEIVILVKIDKPQVDNAWGATTAAPAFSRIAQRIFVLLGIPPNDVDVYNAALTDGL